MLGCFSLFISWISFSMFVLFERCLFIFSTITFPVTWKWILVTGEGGAGCSSISFFVKLEDAHPVCNLEDLTEKSHS